MRIQYKIIYNRRKKLKSNGTASVLVEAYLDRHRRYFNTGIDVEPKFWDKKKNVISVKHELYQSYNRHINSYLKKLEDFEINFTDKNGSFVLADFDYFNTSGNNDDFTLFFQNMMLKRGIKESTQKAEKTTLRYLKEFKETLRFSDLNYQIINEFNSFLLDKKLHINTVHRHHKIIKTYINIAIKSKLIELKNNPYIDYKVKKIQTQRITVSEEELEQISKLEFNKNTENIRSIRDMFLFSCYTGLRFSDLQALKIKHIEKDKNDVNLLLRQKKTEKFIGMPLQLLFESKPLIIIEPYLKDTGDAEAYVFPRYTNQAANRLLKVVALSLNINKHLTFHVARHTFGTLLAAITGDQFLIKSLMGHSDIKTSMIYIHLSDKNIKDKLNDIKW